MQLNILTEIKDMKVNKKQLQDALEIVKPGLASKELIDQSTSFAFVGGKVVTYNDEISISHPVEGLDLNGAIPAEQLYKFLGKVKGDDLEFNIEGNEIILTTGKATAGLTLQSEIKLPLDEEVSEIGKWYPLPENFINNIKFVMTACSRDMSQPVLTCVHVNKNGYVEASDGYRIAKHNLTAKMPVGTFLIPSSSVVDMVKLNPTRIAEGKGWIHFRTRNSTVISCRTFNKDTFPKTFDLLNVEGVELELPKEVEEVLSKAMVFAKRDHVLDEIITINIDPGTLLVSADSDSGWFREEIECSYDGDPIEFMITPYLLKGILSDTRTGILSNTKLKFEEKDWVCLILLRSTQ
jgi:DNA polymerase III sliding clamp (beta) subunit (PCNA family)